MIFGRRVRAVLAMAVGSAPSFLLAFFASAALRPEVSDVFLIAVSFAALLTAITASTTEASAVAIISAHLAQGYEPGRWALGTMSVRATVFATVAAFVVLPVLAAIYCAAGTLILSDVLRCFFAVVIGPIAAAGAAPWSATLIARGQLPKVYISTVFRGSVPLAILTFTSSAPLLCMSYAVGEVMRAAFLVALALPRTGVSREHPGVPRLSELLHQLASMSIMQAIPVFMRFLLAAGPPGSISIGEMANRIYSAASQLLTSGLVMGHVVTMAASTIGRPATEVRLVLRGACRDIVVRSSAAALALVALCCACAPLMSDYNVHGGSRGLLWSIALIVVIPAALVNSWGSRVLILAGRTRLFPAVSATAVASMVALSFALQPFASPFNGIVGMAGSIAITGALCFVFALRCAGRLSALGLQA